MVNVTLRKGTLYSFIKENDPLSPDECFLTFFWANDDIIMGVRLSTRQGEIFVNDRLNGEWGSEFFQRFDTLGADFRIDIYTTDTEFKLIFPQTEKCITFSPRNNFSLVTYAEMVGILDVDGCLTAAQPIHGHGESNASSIEFALMMTRIDRLETAWNCRFERMENAKYDV